MPVADCCALTVAAALDNLRKSGFVLHRPNQGETVTDATATTDFDTRLAALDRAINRLQANHEATPDEVVALAEQFEKYLTRSCG